MQNLATLARANFVRGLVSTILIVLFIKKPNDYVYLVSINVFLSIIFSSFFLFDVIKSYKLKDLSDNNNDGEIVNCEITELTIDDTIEISLPYRRKSLFESLPHEENGFFENNFARCSRLM